MQALQLNADLRPLKVISYQRAVSLVLEGTAYTVEGYAGLQLRSPSIEMPWPAVIALKRYVNVSPRVRFNRANVMARDRYICQYCAKTFEIEDLTLDHVVPRSQAREGRVRLPWSGKNVPVTSWSNTVAACQACNSTKGPRTPGEAGMKLLRFPTKPSPWDCVMMPFLRKEIPEEWKRYAPPEWHDYWTGELDPG